MNKTILTYNSFRQFWPFYVSQHSHSVNRLLHLLGTILAFSIGGSLIYKGFVLNGIALGLILGYGCAWSGHFFFEKNKPATFKYPFYSFIGDLKMFFLLITGQELVMPFNKKIFFITGANRGIGLGLVKHFLLQGHDVYAGVRKPGAALNTLLTELAIPFKGQLHILELDITNEEQIKNAYENITTTNRTLIENSPAISAQEFVLINNAGISGGGPFELLTQQHWQDVFNINVMGAVNLTRTFLPLIRKTQGKVINIGSISGRITSPFLTSYSSSKFALRAISDGLRRELKPLGVSVVLIEPGPIATDIWNTSMQNSLAMIGNATPEVVDVYSENIKKLEADIQNIAKSTVTVDYLITFIDEAANSLHPKPYYKVGKNIGLVFALSHLLPARILDGLLTGGLRFKKLK